MGLPVSAALRCGEVMLCPDCALGCNAGVLGQDGLYLEAEYFVEYSVGSTSVGAGDQAAAIGTGFTAEG